MKKPIKFRVVFWRNDPEKMSIVDETNSKGRYLIGLDGMLYENYGTKDNPIWEIVFDSDYEIEIVEERKVITFGVTKKWWQFWKVDEVEFALKHYRSQIPDHEDYYISVKNKN